MNIELFFELAIKKLGLTHGKVHTVELDIISYECLSSYFGINLHMKPHPF